MKKRIILKCRYCTIESIIKTPRRRLKVVRIEIRCPCCFEINSYGYAHKIDRKTNEKRCKKCKGKIDELLLFVSHSRFWIKRYYHIKCYNEHEGV